MPTYEYNCSTCDNNFEVFQSMSDEPLKKCPECGSTVKRLVGGGLGIIFKGSGFYVTDNKKSSYKSAGSSGSSEGSGDSSAASAPTPASAAAGAGSGSGSGSASSHGSVSSSGAEKSKASSEKK